MKMITAVVRPFKLDELRQAIALLGIQGVTVTEYANAGGVVFAVTWKGPFKPDLQQLLGSYFSPYVDAAKTQTQQLNLSLVTGSDIVVHSAGRMRGFIGVAWVPSLVPAGFDPSTLQP